MNLLYRLLLNNENTEMSNYCPSAFLLLLFSQEMLSQTWTKPFYVFAARICTNKLLFYNNTVQEGTGVIKCEKG